MYEVNSSDASGFHLGDPLLYTGSHLRNHYVLANSVLKHINVYQSIVRRMDYSMLFGLKGAIRSFTEHQKSDEPYDTTPKAVTFNFDRNGELVSMVWVNSMDREVITLKNSLADLKQMVIEKHFMGNITREWTFYKPFMKFERFEKEVNGQVIRTMAQDWSRNIKYMVRNNRVTGRIDITNSSNEQTKRVTCFDKDYNVISSIATEQKNKSTVVYETHYNYRADQNISTIKYARHKPGRRLVGNTSDVYNFDYDGDGYLIAVSGIRNLETLGDVPIPGTDYQYDNEKNLVFKQEFNWSNELHFELHNDHRYDNTGNWIFKKSTLHRFDNGRRVHVYQKDFKRVIDYY